MNARVWWNGTLHFSSLATLLLFRFETSIELNLALSRCDDLCVPTVGPHTQHVCALSLSLSLSVFINLTRDSGGH